MTDLNTLPRTASARTSAQPQPTLTAARTPRTVVVPATVQQTRPEPASAAPVAPVPTQDEAMEQLAVVIDALVGVAFSDKLPAPGPNSPSGSAGRPLEVQRRAYVQSQALVFANHHPQLWGDPTVAVEAVIRANEVVARRQLALDNRARALNGVAPVVEAHVPVAAPEAPAYNAKLAANVERVMSKLMGIPRKFTDDDVIREPRLKQAAAEYLLRYQGRNEFMSSVRAKLDVRPEFAAASLSVPQARGVLNVWMSVYRSSQKPTPAS